MRDVESLIQDAFSGHPLSTKEIQAIAELVGHAGFDPRRHVNASREIAGIVWQGQRVEAAQRIEVNVAHYLKHVVVQWEWPLGTTLAMYEANAASAAQNPGAGIFISAWQGNHTIGVISYAATARGLRGSGWISVEYRVISRHWVTAFQPMNGLDYVYRPRRARLQWLRHPS